MKIKRHKEYRTNVWDRWFAWHPVIVADYNYSYWVWLETVERDRHISLEGEHLFWDYRFVGKPRACD